MKFQRSQLLALALIASLLVAFQNCTRSAVFSSTPKQSLTPVSNVDGGNGGGYEGKPDGFYYRFVSGFTCEGMAIFKARIEFNGNKIYLLENKSNLCATQVRELTPAEIDVSLSGNATVIFNNSVYTKLIKEPVGIPQSLNDVLCRDNFENPTMEISTQFNQTLNATSTRLSRIENSQITTSMDPNSSRSTVASQLNFSTFANELLFQVYLDRPVSGQSQRYIGQITTTDGSLASQINQTELTCVLSSYVEPRLRFTGASDAGTPASNRIFRQAMGSWNLSGECDVLQGPVTIKGEAIDAPAVTACGPDGSFSQTIQFSGNSPMIKFDPQLFVNRPQVIAQQGVNQAITRIYALPSTKTVLFVGTAAELQGISINGLDLDLNRIIVLTNDIDLATISPTNNFVRLTAGETFDRNHFFSTIYGDSRHIENLNMTSGVSANSNNPSLLGYANAIGIFDLHLRNVKIVSTQDKVGAIAGSARQLTAVRVSVAGDISSTGSMVGGLFGYGWDPKIHESWFNGSVSGRNSVGGLVGHFWDDYIVDSWSGGTVTATAGVAGGLVGYLFPGNAFAYIANSYSTSSVSGLGAVGGLIGQINCSVACTSNSRDSFATGAIVNTSVATTGLEFVGPVVGANADSMGVTNPGVTLTQLFSLDSALCVGCSTASQAYSTTKTWPELNSFAGVTWNFTEIWKPSLNIDTGPPVLRYNP